MAAKKKAEIIDPLTLGIILLGKDGLVVGASKKADQILQANSLRLGIVDQQLVLKNEQLNRQLQSNISTALNPRDHASGHSGGAITLKAGDGGAANGRQRIELLISPFNVDCLNSQEQATSLGALVFLKDYGKRSIPSAKILFELYGLTATEVEVCQAMLDNLNTQEIAEWMSVGVEAVRYHYKNLYKKLGARRQSELVQVIASSVAGITCDV